MYRIAYTREAKERIERLSGRLKAQIKRAIERIAKNPGIGKHLTGELSGISSYRTGKFRIIYRVFHKEILVLILTVGYRKDIYQRDISGVDSCRLCHVKIKDSREDCHLPFIHHPVRVSL